MKHIFLLFSLFIGTTLTFAQDTDRDASSKYNPKAYSITTFANVSGVASNAVNLLTGDASVSVPLLNVSGRMGLDISVGLAYSSNVQQQIGTWNPEAPNGLVGPGWNLSTPSSGIWVDHKQTSARDDDDIYWQYGGATNLLVRSSPLPVSTNPYSNYPHSNTVEYKTKNYTNVKIVRYLDNSSNEKWEITQEDGTLLVYGDLYSNRNTLAFAVAWGNWIGDHGNSSQANAGRMPYLFNLSEVVNKWGEKLLFEYELSEKFVGPSGGLKYTEATYLKSITEPMGRKVVFSYQTNPHEKRLFEDTHAQKPFFDRYLDKVELLGEDNATLVSVKLSYNVKDANTDKAKLMLASIVQSTPQGGNMPSMKFTYDLNGRLTEVTHPTGAKQVYTYTSSVPLKQSVRDIMAEAPNGYSRPRVWAQDDYIVITWCHPDTKDIIVHIYHWVGKWVKHDMGSCGRATYAVSLGYEGLNDYAGYNANVNPPQQTEFSIGLQQDFFVIAVVSPYTQKLSIYYKDETRLSNWKTYSDYASSADHNTISEYSDIVITVSRVHTGNKFVMWQGTLNSARVYTFTGDSWIKTMRPACRDCKGVAYNNYIIRNKMEPDPDQVSISFLTDALIWRDTNPAHTFNSLNMGRYIGGGFAKGNTEWVGNQSFALCQTFLKEQGDDQPEYVFHWNRYYENMYANELVGGHFGFGANGQGGCNTFVVDNATMVMMNSNTANNAVPSRFFKYNGVNWGYLEGRKAMQGDGDASTHAVAPNIFMYMDPNTPYNTIIKTYNNAVAWDTYQKSHTHSPPPNDKGNKFNSWPGNPLRIGKRYLFVADKIYFSSIDQANYNQPKITLSPSPGYPASGIYSKLSQNKVNIFANGALAIEEERWLYAWTSNTGPITLLNAGGYGYVYFIRNNGDDYTIRNFSGYLLKSYENSNTLITIPQTFPWSRSMRDVTQIKLHRVLNDDITGTLTDTPVSMVTMEQLNNGVYERISATKFEYDTDNAMADASGTIAYYPKVTVSQLNASNLLAENGKTVNYFYVSGDTPQTTEAFWMGSAYKTEVFDKNDVLVAQNKTTFQNYAVNLGLPDNTNSVKMYCVRPVKQESMREGITSVTEMEYNQYGQAKTEKVYDIDSKGDKAIFTTYEYLWEKEPEVLSSGLMPCVVSVKKELRTAPNWTLNTTLSNQITVWKKTNNVWHEHKGYAWRRMGDANFSYAQGVGTNEPSPHIWDKLWEINAIDSKGNVLQKTTK